MRNIVLITRENGERVTHVSVVLYDDYREAAKLHGLVNKLFSAGDEKLTAMRISMGREYVLEKGAGFCYDDLTGLDNRTIQKIMREIDTRILTTALLGSSEAVKELIFRNMSKRAAGMLQEDMTYSGPVFESEIEEAKQCILDAYDCVRYENEDSGEFQSIFDKYAEEETKDRDGKESQSNYRETGYIALVFRGKKEVAETVSVAVFDSYDARDNFCEFINKLKPSGASFIFAREAEQMTEYEITKPLLARFDQIARWDGIVIGTALRKVDSFTLAAAIRGMNKETKEDIIGNLPRHMADDVMLLLDTAPPHENARRARQKIVNTIITVEKQFKKGKLSIGCEIIKD